jgi:hypothetical protein
MKNYIHKSIIFVLSIIVIIVVITTLYSRLDYYMLEQLDRPHHIDHKLWKPGGEYGHGFGIIGSIMLVTLFLYSLRKRVNIFKKWGKLPVWLNYHIFLGIAGPTLIVIHTTFKFGGLVSISFWSMIFVALSGFIGRYIYTKIPHHINGKEISLKEYELYQKSLTQSLEVEFNLTNEHLDLIEKLSGVNQIVKRGNLGIFTLFSMDFYSWFTIQQIVNEITEITNIPNDRIKWLKKLVKSRIKAHRQIAFWSSAHSLFHYWHVIHKPFAYTMIFIMLIHTAIAVILGYTWIF